MLLLSENRRSERGTRRQNMHNLTDEDYFVKWPLLKMLQFVHFKTTVLTLTNWLTNWDFEKEEKERKVGLNFLGVQMCVTRVFREHM